MQDTTLPPREPVRRITDRDIAALFGADRAGRMWRVYRELEGSLTTPPETDLASMAREAWIDGWIAGGFLVEGEARRPTQAVDHPSLPVTVQPDIALPTAPTLGEGWGMATLATVTPRRFHQQWMRPGSPAQPPESELLRLQTILMTTGAKWGAVIPAVGTSGYRDPIVVPGNTELQNEIARTVTETWERVRRNDPPPPDARADARSLAALSASIDRRQARIPNAAELGHIQSCAEQMQRLQEQLAEETAAVQPLRMRLESVQDELRTALAEFGTVEVNGERLWIQARSPNAQPAAAREIDIMREPLAQ